MVQVDGIEPTNPAWKAGVLPLNYTCLTYNKCKHFSLHSSSVFFMKKRVGDILRSAIDKENFLRFDIMYG